MDNKKIIIIIAAVLGVAALIVGFTVYGLFLRKPAPTPVELVMWAPEPQEHYAGIFALLKEAYPHVTVAYRAFTNAASYESALLDALAAGEGPDVFTVQNSDLPRKLNKLFPAPATMYGAETIQRDFPDTVYRDFVREGRVYALPLYIDTLALLYNRDLLNEAGIAFPPATWEEVQEAAGKLVKFENNRMTRSGIALGGARGVVHAKEIISTLMFQNGAEMVTEGYTAAAFASSPGVSAFSFYLQFAQPASSAYAWDDSLGNSRNLFAAGRGAMVIDTAEGRGVIAAKAPFLNFSVAPLPKIDGRQATYAAYRGVAVSRQSRSAQAAWALVITMAANSAYAERYASASARPPALRTLINKYLNDPGLGVFAGQALIGRAWAEPDPEKVSVIFEDMIEKGLIGANAFATLKAAQDSVTNLMRTR